MSYKTSKIPGKVYAAISATGLMSFSGVLVETAMNVAFPTLMKEFGVATNVVQWMTSIYLLAISVIVPLSAVLKSTFKTKKLFITANLLFLAGLLIDGFAPNFSLLLLGRGIQGAGTGIALPLMFNIILEQVPMDRIGTMMGFGNLITGIAPALGPAFGGIIINSLGWRYVFYFLIPLILISLFLGIYGIQQKSKIVKITPDALSIVLIAIFFTGMIYGFSKLSEFGGETIISILLAIIAIILLLKRSSHLKQPTLNFALLKNQAFSAHLLGFLLVQLCSLGNAFLLPNYVQLVNANTVLAAGLLVMPAGVAGALMSLVGGRMYDKYGARKPILTGVALMAAEILAFAAISFHMNNLEICLIYVLYMTGMGMLMGNVMTDALAQLDQKEQSQGNAFMNTVQQFAGAIGTSITSAIVALSQGGHATSANTAAGTQHAFIFLGVLVVCLFVLFYKAIKPSDQAK